MERISTPSMESKSRMASASRRIASEVNVLEISNWNCVDVSARRSRTNLWRVRGLEVRYRSTHIKLDMPLISSAKRSTEPSQVDGHAGDLCSRYLWTICPLGPPRHSLVLASASNGWIASQTSAERKA